MKYLLCLSMVFLLAACQSRLPELPAWQSPEGLEHEDLGRIIDLHDGRVLTPRELVDRLSNAPRVLLGERHDNPDHHALQLWLLQAMAERREQGSVVMEMINPEQQALVTQAQQRLQSGEQIDDLAGALNWQKGWDWKLYGALVSHALSRPYPLLAANLDRSEIMDIYRQIPELSGPASTTEAVRNGLLEQIRVSHCGMLPEAQLPAMLSVQQHRDRRMADVLAAAAEPSVLIAGAYHVRRDLGVPLHLQDLSMTGEAVVIFAEVGAKIDASMADYVWYTAAMPEQDHCLSLRQKKTR